MAHELDYKKLSVVVLTYIRFHADNLCVFAFCYVFC